MVIRKNISLEISHIKKLEPLSRNHEGNLSAAIRDAVDIADAALRRYGTVEKALAGVQYETRESSAREKTIETGKNILLGNPIFLWALKWTKGIPLDKEIIDELLDPLKIRTLSELDKNINEISKLSGWNCEVSIFSMDDINPMNATVAISGENESYRDFVAQLVIMFLVYNKGLDIDLVHRRASAVRIDLKRRDEGTDISNAKMLFGDLKDTLDIFTSRKDFWKELAWIYNSVNYNMVSLHRNHYEDLLAGNVPEDGGIFESISKKHISSIPHSDFLKLLKQTHESLRIIDRIEILDNSINVYHNYKNERSAEKIRDYYIQLFRANGHEYKAKYSSSLIVLNHVCCRN